MYLIYYHFIIRRLDPLELFPQQFLCLLVHAGQLLGDGVLRAVLLLRQALDPPDLRQELADLLGNVPAILLSHGKCGSILLKAPFIFPFSFSLNCWRPLQYVKAYEKTTRKQAADLCKISSTAGTRSFK